MGLIRQPRNIDFTVKSEPWTEEELADFRMLMATIKAKKATAVKTVTKPARTKKSSTGKKLLA